MKKLTLYLFVLSLCPVAKMVAFDLDTRPGFLKSVTKDYEIVIQNRPLAKIHGKTISVMDVKKRMDLNLREHHPETLRSNAMLYHYYTSEWRNTLTDMIQNELIQMEAEEFKVPVSDGDIRESMMKRFGPNLFARLDELQITYDEAKELAKEEIIVRNMSWYRVWARVFQLVGPDLIKQEYDTYVKAHPPKDEWIYKTVTIRSQQKELSEKVASDAYTLLASASLEEMQEDLKVLTSNPPEGVSVSVSNEFHLASNALSPEYRSILGRLPLGGISMPETQVSRSDGSFVKRIFYLIDHHQDPPPVFEEISPKIRDSLMQRYVDLQKHEYFTRLRKRFCCEHLVVEKLFSPDYQPFSIY